MCFILFSVKSYYDNLDHFLIKRANQNAFGEELKKETHPI